MWPNEGFDRYLVLVVSTSTNMTPKGDATEKSDNPTLAKDLGSSTRGPMCPFIVLCSQSFRHFASTISSLTWQNAFSLTTNFHVLAKNLKWLLISAGLRKRV